MHAVNMQMNAMRFFALEIGNQLTHRTDLLKGTWLGFGRMKMPEGPEVKRNAVDLAKIITESTLEQVEVVSGRYTRNELVGLNEFKQNLPCKVLGAGCHGKFIYLMFNNGWNLWSTLGMTGIWSKNKSSHTRFRLSTDSSTVYYNDIRNFGTLKFVYGRHELLKKLSSLGVDLLSQEVTNENFLEKMRRHDSKNICKVVMNQSVLAGVGNYIKAEALWMTRMNPNKAVSDFEDFQLLELKEALQEIMKSSYSHGGATFLTHTDFSGYKGEYTGRFLCYNRKIDAEGHKVIKTKTPDGRTTHWSVERQGENNVQ